MRYSISFLAIFCGVTVGLFAKPDQTSAYLGQPQQIPGAVFCVYYDLGGEGVGYHDGDAVNNGSGKLNPADGSYLNEFRMGEGPDISYTKQYNDLDSPSNKVTPPLGLLYVGWTEPGEWFDLSVNVSEAGRYDLEILYTAQRDAKISIQVVGVSDPWMVGIPSTFDEAETVAWRQWHHWNVVSEGLSMELPEGESVLRIRIEEGGNMNLATLLFRKSGMSDGKMDILKANTPER